MCSTQVFVGFAVEPCFGREGDEFQEHPFAQLAFGAILAFVHLKAQSFQLSLVEAVRQILQHVLRAGLAGIGGAGVALFEEVAEDLHLAPDVVIDEPFDHVGHCLCPSLVVEHPEDATCFPGGKEGSLGAIPKDVVVGEVGEGGHVGGEVVGELVELGNDEAAFAGVETDEVIVEFLVELVGVLALAGYASVAGGAGLVGEDHATEGAVEEIVTVELARGEGGGGDSEVAAEDGVSGDAVGGGAEGAGALAVVDVAEHLADLLVTAADTVGHFDLREVEILCATAEGFAGHSVLEECCGGDIRGREPEGHIGTGGFLLV